MAREHIDYGIERQHHEGFVGRVAPLLRGPDAEGLGLQ
jgi:hypothetical protein